MTYLFPQAANGLQVFLAWALERGTHYTIKKPERPRGARSAPSEAFAELVARDDFIGTYRDGLFVLHGERIAQVFSTRGSAHKLFEHAFDGLPVCLVRDPAWDDWLVRVEGRGVAVWTFREWWRRSSMTQLASMGLAGQ